MTRSAQRGCEDLTDRHRLSFDSGRVSSISTRSPTLLAFGLVVRLERFDRVITRS